MDSKLQISIVTIVLSLTMTVLLSTIPYKEALAEPTKPNPRGGDLHLPSTQSILVSMSTSVEDKLFDSGDDFEIRELGPRGLDTRSEGDFEPPKPKPKPSEPTDGGTRDGGSK